MGRRAREHEIDEADVTVGEPKHYAAGVPAVSVALKRAVEHMGVVRSGRTLLKLNQVDGFDCQGCAWPDPDAEHRHTAEFCENGVKAVADEATRDLLDRDFFARHPLAELAERTDYWLNQQGRITEPMVLRDGATHYEPIGWDDAFAMMARHLNAIAPDQAVFYTSGKVSNEAAFLYQLFARAYGTNNLPDCSNMCHESTSVGLAEVIGIGKGSVTLDDIHHAELLVIMGQNPGTNHPRMLSALEIAKKNGAKIIAVNPLKEAGLMRFKNPERARRRRSGHRSGRPLPPGADERRPGPAAGDRAPAAAVGGTRPRLHRGAHRRVRRVRRGAGPAGLGRRPRLDRPVPR